MCLLENGGVLFPQARSVLVGDNIIRACIILSCLCRVTVRPNDLLVAG